MVNFTVTVHVHKHAAQVRFCADLLAQLCVKVKTGASWNLLGYSKVKHVDIFDGIIAFLCLLKACKQPFPAYFRHETKIV